MQFYFAKCILEHTRQESLEKALKGEEQQY